MPGIHYIHLAKGDISVSKTRTQSENKPVQSDFRYIDET